MPLALFVLPGLAAAALSFALTPLARRLAVRVGAVDYPSPRKVHTRPTPRLGGLAVVAAAALVLAAVLALYPGVRGRQLGGAIALGLLPVLLVSVVDDIRTLSPWWKFLGQLAGAGIAVGLGVRLGAHVHLFGAQIPIGALAWPLSILWLVGVTNAFNLVDGLDGLSAGLALISAGTLVPLFVLAGEPGPVLLAIVTAGAIAGFLPWNLNPASVFLGDSGATAIGFALGCLALGGGSNFSAGFATLLPVIVVGVPVADTLVSMARRLVRAGGGGATGMFVADRAHLHHRLLDLGLTHRRVVLVLYGAGLALAGLALASVLLTAQEAGLLLVAVFGAALIGVGRLGYREFGVIRSGAVLRAYDAPVLHRALFVVFVDLALVALGIWAAVGLKYDDWLLEGRRALSTSMLAVLAPCTVAALWLARVYRGAWRLAGIEDVSRIVAGVSAATAAGFLLLRPVTGQSAPISLFLVYALVKGGASVTVRLSYRALDHFRARASADGAPTLIYGAGAGGALALREILSRPEMGLRAVGFIDDSPERRGRIVNGLPVVGTSDDLDRRLLEQQVEFVVVSSWKVAPARVAAAQAACGRAGARLMRMNVRFDDCGVAYPEPREVFFGESRAAERDAS